MKNSGRKTVKADRTSAPKASKARAAAPTHDEIAKRSFELFLARGGEHGHDVEDWVQAEAELLG